MIPADKEEPHTQRLQQVVDEIKLHRHQVPSLSTFLLNLAQAFNILILLFHEPELLFQIVSTTFKLRPYFLLSFWRLYTVIQLTCRLSHNRRGPRWSCCWGRDTERDGTGLSRAVSSGLHGTMAGWCLHRNQWSRSKTRGVFQNTLQIMQKILELLVREPVKKKNPH